jgi:hypothetical protein
MTTQRRAMDEFDKFGFRKVGGEHQEKSVATHIFPIMNEPTCRYFFYIDSRLAVSVVRKRETKWRHMLQAKNWEYAMTKRRRKAYN